MGFQSTHEQNQRHYYNQKKMTSKKNIFIINGSASKNSSNEKLIDNFVRLSAETFSISILNDLKVLPHFDPALSIENTPQEIIVFREKIQNADGILICTPEYIFSIPSGLKNALEWCVSTTLYSDKPVGIITASTSGIKGHEELQLIMKTLMAKFSADTTLLIQGVKGKINGQGEITDPKTVRDLLEFVEAYKAQMEPGD